MSRLHQEFKDKIKPKLMEKFNYKNIHQIPKIKKIVLNMGIGDAKDDSKILDKAQEELSLITGQKAVVTKFKKSISNTWCKKCKGNDKFKISFTYSKNRY